MQLSKKELKQLLSEDKLQELIDLLLQYSSELENHKIQNSVISVSSRFNQLNKEYLMGIISREDSERERNRLRLYLLQIIDDLPQIKTKSSKSFLDNLQLSIINNSPEIAYDEIISSIPDSRGDIYNEVIISKSEFVNDKNKLITSSLPIDTQETILNEVNSFLNNELEGITIQDQLVNKDLIENTIQKFQAANQKLETLIKEYSAQLEKERNSDEEKSSVFKILFLYSNPDDLHTISFGKESKIISEELQKGKLRAQFELLPPIGSIRYDEIKRIIRETEPSFIHFSVHGSKDKGLLFEDQNGYPKEISVKQLTVTIKQATKSSEVDIECILINACHSAGHANGIIEHKLASNTIGMNDYIPDEASLVFTQGFYEELFNSNDIDEAFENGTYKIMMEDVQINEDEFKDKEWEKVPELITLK